MAKGKIESFDAQKGQGYIMPSGGGERVSFQADAVTDERVTAQLQAGEEVTYEEEDGTAVKVDLVAPRGYG